MSYLPSSFLIFFIFSIAILSIETESSSLPLKNQIKSKIKPTHLNSLHQQLKAKEEELRAAEEINRNFERMIQLVNILGQVDNFLSERTKSVIKKLAVLVEDEDEIERQLSGEN